VNVTVPSPSPARCPVVSRSHTPSFVPGRVAELVPAAKRPTATTVAAAAAARGMRRFMGVL